MRTQEHAVIIGGSVAGLLAAGAAAKHFERVTVLERDVLEDGPTFRKGAPQGNQIHVLLPVGEEKIEQIFPGFHQECLDEGCAEIQTSEAAVYTGAGWLLRVALTEAIGFRRPLLEWVIRRRLRQLEQVVIKHSTATGLVVDDRGNLVGVGLQSGDQVAADFVVDATGRGTKTPKWLETLGFDAPQTSEVRMYMGYATQIVRIPDGTFEAGLRALVALPDPGHSMIGGVISPVDNDFHAIAAAGMMKHYPPADREGVLDFLDGAPTPLLAEVARKAEPVSELHTYRMPSNLRRRWEDLDRRPGRFIAIGDAVASFDPIYGQGITVAAIGAALLEETLSEAADDLDSVSSRFQDGLSATVDLAFSMAACNDMGYEGAEIINFDPPPGDDEDSHHLEALLTHDPEVVAAFFTAVQFLRPEVLETEEIRAKIALQAASGRQALESDPQKYPRTVTELPSDPHRSEVG